MENIISKFFSRLAINRLVSRSSYVLGINLPVGITASNLYNKAYSFYYDTYKKEGYSSLWESKRALLAELKKLDIKSWSLPAEPKASGKTNSASKIKNTRTPIDYKMMTFKKNFPNLFIFKDFIFKQDAKIENLVFIQKILTIVVKGTFIPLVILSIYIWIRRYFLWTSAIFTSSYVSLRFVGQSDYINKISDSVASIRDGIVKIITNLVGVFLDVDLVNREQVYEQVRAEAMNRLAQYDQTIRDLESIIRSLRPMEEQKTIPKEVFIVKSNSLPKSSGGSQGAIWNKFNNLDPYIDKTSDFIYNNLPELNIYTVGIGVIACTALYFYVTGDSDKSLISVIRSVSKYVGQAFAGLANITEPDTSSATPDNENNAPVTNNTDGTSNSLASKGKSKETAIDTPQSQLVYGTAENRSISASANNGQRVTGKASWVHLTNKDNSAQAVETGGLPPLPDEKKNTTSTLGKSRVNFVEPETALRRPPKITSEGRVELPPIITITKATDLDRPSFSAVSPSSASPTSSSSSSSSDTPKTSNRPLFTPVTDTFARAGSTMFPIGGASNSSGSIVLPGVGLVNRNNILDSLDQASNANNEIISTGRLGLSQAPADGIMAQLMASTPNRPNWDSNTQEPLPANVLTVPVSGNGSQLNMAASPMRNNWSDHTRDQDTRSEANSNIGSDGNGQGGSAPSPASALSGQEGPNVNPGSPPYHNIQPMPHIYVEDLSAEDITSWSNKLFYIFGANLSEDQTRLLNKEQLDIVKIAKSKEEDLE